MNELKNCMTVKDLKELLNTYSDNTVVSVDVCIVSEWWVKGALWVGDNKVLEVEASEVEG